MHSVEKYVWDSNLCKSGILPCLTQTRQQHVWHVQMEHGSNQCQFKIVYQKMCDYRSYQEEA